MSLGLRLVCLSVPCRFVRLFYVGLQDAIFLLFWFCLSVLCRVVRCCSFGLVVLSSLVSCWFARDVILLSLWLWRVCFIVLILQRAVLAFDNE